MPKVIQHELVLQDWLGALTFQEQAVLLTGIRGPDENNKYNVAKAIVRYLRGVVIKPAGFWDGSNNNDWCWGEYKAANLNYIDEFGRRYSRGFKEWQNLLLQDHDEYPHHFLMHLIHCAEVIGYKHPNNLIKSYWHSFYMEFVNAFHMKPETEEEMDNRLNDFNNVNIVKQNGLQ